MASTWFQCSICTPFISWSRNYQGLKGHVVTYEQRPQSTLGTFDRSFQNGCQVCGIIHAAVSKFFQDHPGDFVSNDPQEAISAVYPPTRGSTIQLSAAGKGLQIFVEGESTLPFAFGQLRPMITDPSSPKLQRFIQEALESCCRDHGRCGISQYVPLPTRLLNVGNIDQPPFLHTTQKGELGQYICLSHCWGSPSYTLQTRKANLEAYAREIPLINMPRTFSEAVMLTRRIGLQYIWIDSLCIVQDDKEDWTSESETMAQTYTNSWITIVAAEAVDSREGLFPRVAAEDGNVSYIDWSLPGAQVCRVYVRKNNIFHRKFKMYKKLQQSKPMASETAALFSRGWTVQELLLPPRLLMCTARGPIWYCNKSFQPATDPIPYDFEPHVKGAYQSLLFEESPGSGINRQTKLFKEPNTKVPFVSRDNLSTFGDGWANLVVMYTSRRLTFRQDRLRALAGLAKKLQRQSKAEYVAGLWDDKVSLPFLLAWDAAPVETRRETPCGDPTECTRSWNPPSWSWASVEGAILWPHNLSSFCADAKITDVSCQWQDTNRFSTSLGGEITMEVKTLKLPRSTLFCYPQGKSPDIEARRTTDGMLVAPGDYCYQISHKDLFSQYQLSQLPELSGETLMFKVPGSICGLHRLDWIKQHSPRSVDIRLVLLGTWTLGERLAVLILAQHPDTGKFIRIDSGKRLLNGVRDLFPNRRMQVMSHLWSGLDKLFSLPMEIVLT